MMIRKSVTLISRRYIQPKCIVHYSDLTFGNIDLGLGSMFHEIAKDFLQLIKTKTLILYLILVVTCRDSDFIISSVPEAFRSPFLVIKYQLRRTRTVSTKSSNLI